MNRGSEIMVIYNAIFPRNLVILCSEERYENFLKQSWQYRDTVFDFTKTHDAKFNGSNDAAKCLLKHKTVDQKAFYNKLHR